MIENSKKDVSSEQEILLKSINRLVKIENFEKCGQIIDCKVIKIDKKSGLVHLDIGLRADATVSIKEFFKKDEKANLKVGDFIKAQLVSLDFKGSPLVDHAKITKAESLSQIKEIFQNPEEERRVIKGIPFMRNGRMIFVDVEGVICLLPVNQIEARTLEEEGFMGTVQSFKILKAEGENILLSKKSVLNEEEIEEINAFVKIVKEGDIAECEVKAIFPYGVFVTIKSLKSTDTGEVTEMKTSSASGFIYVNDISWKKIHDPSEELSIGQIISAKVLKNKNEGQNKIALSIKDLTENPRAKLLEIFKEGDIVNCKVTEIADYGLFVDFNHSINNTEKYEGFIHNSEISWKREEQNNKQFKIGDEFDAKIMELDLEKKKVPLSKKGLTKSPVEEYCKEKDFKIGDELELEVSRILPYGVILFLGDNKLEVLLHVKDMFWNTNNYEYFLKKYNIGDMIKVRYLGYCDILNRAKITTKDIGGNSNPYVKFKTLKEGDSIVAEVIDVKVDKTYVLYNSVIFTIDSSELPKNFNPTIGDNVKAKIIGFKNVTNPSVNKEESEAQEDILPIFSIREYLNDENKKMKDKYNSGNTGGSSLADILGFALDKAIIDKNKKDD